MQILKHKKYQNVYEKGKSKKNNSMINLDISLRKLCSHNDLIPLRGQRSGVTRQFVHHYKIMIMTGLAKVLSPKLVTTNLQQV